MNRGKEQIDYKDSMTEECLYEGNEYVKKYDFQICTESKKSFFQSEKKYSLFLLKMCSI